jgi:hypothetical protein
VWFILEQLSKFRRSHLQDCYQTLGC